MKFKCWLDISMLAFISATILFLIDLFLFTIFLIRTISSDIEGFWIAIYGYFFQSWYVGLHIVIVSLFVVAFVILNFIISS